VFRSGEEAVETRDLAPFNSVDVDLRGKVMVWKCDGPETIRIRADAAHLPYISTYVSSELLID
jgi:hypothetical protein